MHIQEFHKKKSTKVNPEKHEEVIKKMRKEHEKMVKGMFEFLDAQGGWLEFCYRFFKDDPIYKIRLVHGEITELPMGIVKHLNNTKKKVRRYDNVNMSAEPHKLKSFDTVSRVRFTPMDVL